LITIILSRRLELEVVTE